MNIMMVCPRNYVLRTRIGHTIEFKANTPTPVPEAAYAEALSKNIVPVEVPDTEKPHFELAHADITGTLRDALIYFAIDEITKRNNPEDFGGGGVPKAKLVSEMIGVSVSHTEVGKYWQNYRQMIANNEDLPMHPKMELVLELQALSSRQQMERFAADIDMPLPKTKGKGLRELKGMLLYALVNGANMAPAVAADAYVPPKSLAMD